MKNKESGFTLLELSITVGIMLIVFGVLITGIKPKTQIERTRNAERLAHIRSIIGAVNHFTLETFGDYPTAIDSQLRMIGTASSGCNLICGQGDVEEEGESSFPSDLIDDSETDFNAGTHSDTEWSGSFLGLNDTGMQITGAGNFISEVKDATEVVEWSNLAPVIGAPYGKALPNLFTTTESGYPSGNMSMTSNVLLYHMDEASGVITDSSGTGNNGTTPAGVTYNQTGLFNTSLKFNGANNYINVPYNASMRLPNTGGAMGLWFYIDPTLNLSQDTGMGLIRVLNDSNWSAPSGFGLEVYRNTPGGPLNLRTSIARVWNDVQINTGSTSLQLGQWYHAIFTWDTNNINIYLNGQPELTAPKTKTVTWGQNQPTVIGHNFAAISTGRAWFKGNMDDLFLFSRLISPSEALGMYRRGALTARFQARSCLQSNCSDTSFTGPDGTGNSYYSESSNTGSTPLTYSLTNLEDNRYFQYKVFLDTSNSAMTPEISMITLVNSGGGEEEPSGDPMETASSCIDLTSDLVPNYISSIPFDPVTGSDEKTNYAVREIPGGIEVYACTPALNETIMVTQ